MELQIRIMDTVQQDTFDSVLAQHDERAWCEALDLLLPLIHPVDQDATRVWFAFWPLHLYRIIQESENLDQTAQKLELRGGYLLEDQLQSSLSFLFGSRYWPEVKEAVCSHAVLSNGKTNAIKGKTRPSLNGMGIIPDHLVVRWG